MNDQFRQRQTIADFLLLTVDLNLQWPSNL
jgi:hypothetical protein